MQLSLANKQGNIQLPLYSGIAMIVISMLFLGRDAAHSSFWVQAAAMLAAPIFFYIVGSFLGRHVNAPLAAAGITATGAWLIGVTLIHLHGKRDLLPPPLGDYYWLVASTLAAGIITVTGHRLNTRLLMPLMPLAQINALWAVMGAFGISVAWIPPLSFVLVYVWWEFPFRSQQWGSIYRVFAAGFTLFLLVFNLWLPAATGETHMAAWIAGAVVVALIGLRHGWTRLAPLAIVMLAVAVAWGMPRAAWSPLWLALASAAMIVIERAKDAGGKDARAIELTEALAVALSGFAAALAVTAPMFGVWMNPLGVVGVLAAAGVLMVWLGWRRGLRIAAHVGLWLTASAWGSLYFIAAPSSGTFGLWLALFATCALLVERILTSRSHEKRKAPYSLIETVVRWPFADLVIGLSAMILLWSALNIDAVAPGIIAATLLIAISTWVAAGMIYRLPILLHVALWIAPIPYSLLLILAAPALWTLPLLGVAWQLLGVVYVTAALFSPRYRPAMLAPFYLAGYGLLGVGLMASLPNPVLVPLSLGIVVLVWIATSAAVMLDRHPGWDVFVERIVSPDTRPFAYKHIHSLFLYFSAWFAAVWIQLVLGTTGAALSRQGMFLVVFASLFFLVGRALGRIPGAATGAVTSAGWLLWIIGLLQVFFSPTEAIVTLILGLALSGEALARSRKPMWLPIVGLHLVISTLEITWLLSVPARLPLMMLGLMTALAGAWYEQRSRLHGRILAASGTAAVVFLTILQPDSLALAALLSLVLGAVVLYRDARLLYGGYVVLGLLMVSTSVRFGWEGWLALGVLQWIVGAELLKRFAPQAHYLRLQALFPARSLDTPVLAAGTLCVGLAYITGMRTLATTLSPVAAISAVTAFVLVVYSARLRARTLPTLALLSTTGVLAALAGDPLHPPFAMIGAGLMQFSLLLGLGALALWLTAAYLLAAPKPRWLVWWIRPFIGASVALAVFSFAYASAGMAYPGSASLQIAPHIVIIIWCVLVHIKTKRAVFLVLAVPSVIVIAGALGVRNPYLLIVLMLLMIAQRTSAGHQWYELSAAALLLVGGGQSVRLDNFLAPTNVLFAAQIVGLALYGLAAGRRIPFGIGAAALAVMLTGAIWRVNLWLIPLGGGLLLVGGAVLLEAQRESAERAVLALKGRWQAWK